MFECKEKLYFKVPRKDLIEIEVKKKFTEGGLEPTTT